MTTRAGTLRSPTRLHIHACAAELRQDFFAIAAISRQDRAEFVVLGQRLQGGFRHGVYSERCCQRLYVKDVGCLGVLGSGAGPKEALRTRSGVEGALPARRIEDRSICLVGTLGDGDAEPFTQGVRHLAQDGDVPSADEQRGDRTNRGLQSGIDTPLNATEDRVGGRQILLAGEQ